MYSTNDSVTSTAIYFKSKERKGDIQKKEICFRSLYFSYHLVSLTVKAIAFPSALGINSTLQ